MLPPTAMLTLSASLLVLAAVAPGPFADAAYTTAQNKLLQALERDPSADPYTMLTAEERRAWTRDSGQTINQTIQQLLHIPVKPMIEVKLVGFDGRSTPGLFLSEQQMMRYLRALRADMDTVVLDPVLADLPVRPEFQWMVTHETQAMATQLSTAVHAAVGKESSGDAPQYGLPALISYQVVDDYISRDTNRHSSALLTVYILNLMTGVGRYAYQYKAAEEHPEPSSDFCGGTHYVGPANARTPQYVWIDITAGPVTYGPGPRQKGHVFEHSMPHPRIYKNEILVPALVPQLAATVWSATQHLAWPPVQHLQIGYKTRVVIEIIHIHEGLTHAGEKFSQGAIQEALKQALGTQQIINMHETWLPMSACSLCVEAFTSATRVRTARDEFSSVMSVYDAKVLDQTVLRTLLMRYEDSIFGQAGVAYDTDRQHSQVLPVFIWEVAEHKQPLLFVGGHQAVAFPNMVIAVASHAGKYHTPAVCGFTQVEADASDPTRAVLAAILTAVWGVANTSTAYTPATGPEANHMWSLVNTPYGHLSHAVHMSGPITMHMPRNLALAHLNATTTRLADLLAGFARLSKNGKFDKASCGEFKDRVVARANLALFKVQQAATAFSQADPWRALMHARSLQHEVSHLERLVAKLAPTIGAKLHCESGPTLSAVWWAPCIALATWPIAKFLRGKLYRHKFDKLY